jgi:hypothetical protein
MSHLDQIKSLFKQLSPNEQIELLEELTMGRSQTTDLLASSLSILF